MPIHRERLDFHAQRRCDPHALPFLGDGILAAGHRTTSSTLTSAGATLSQPQFTIYRRRSQQIRDNLPLLSSSKLASATGVANMPCFSWLDITAISEFPDEAEGVRRSFGIYDVILTSDSQRYPTLQNRVLIFVPHATILFNSLSDTPHFPPHPLNALSLSHHLLYHPFDFPSPLRQPPLSLPLPTAGPPPSYPLETTQAIRLAFRTVLHHSAVHDLDLVVPLLRQPPPAPAPQLHVEEACLHMHVGGGASTQ